MFTSKYKTIFLIKFQENFEKNVFVFPDLYVTETNKLMTRDGFLLKEYFTERNF